VAHQWWGHLVSPKSYRDLWLSEGLAEFSGAMYVLKAKKDDGTFLRILRDWRKHVVSSGRLNGQRSVGYKAGALVLGSRLINEKSAGDYTAIVYYKGAYVVNMLRYELMAMYGEDRIMEVLGDFANEHYNSIASTEDFRAVVAKYLGDRTERFFDQWVYDWRLPRIRKDSHRNDDGSLSLKFEIGWVDEHFSTPYPVRILFDDNSFELHHFNLAFGENKFNYQPPEGKKVKAIDYNPYMDILEL
jgi:aminopeptidase N